MSNLGYCIDCGEAMEWENGWQTRTEQAGLFSTKTYYRTVYWCMNEECPRFYLASVGKVVKTKPAPKSGEERNQQDKSNGVKS